MSIRITKKAFEKFINSDEQVYEKIFKDNISRVVFFIQGFVKSQATAEDLSQDVFIKFWEHRARIVAPEAIMPFLFAIARNTALDYIKKTNSHEKYLKEQIHTGDFLCEFENELDTKQLKAQIDRVISDMPMQRKIVFTMSRQEGLEVKEIAEQLKISPKTVYAHLYAAVEEIKKGI